MAKDPVKEDVPRLIRRVGDNMLAGANNATLLLGRDRPGSVESGYGSQPRAGAAHLIVGRKGEDPNPAEDRATFYLSATADPDEIAGTTHVGEARRGVSAAITRGDCVRVSARTDFKISVGRAYLTMDQSGAVTVEGDVSLGHGAADRIIRGDAFASFWANHIHPTPVGPSGTPQPMPPSLLSARNRVL